MKNRHVFGGINRIILRSNLMAIEYPESYFIAEQMMQTLVGRRLVQVSIRDASASVFRWGFVNLHKVDIIGQHIRTIEQQGDEIYLRMEGLNLRFGAMIGKLLYHAPGEKPAPKAQVTFILDNGAAFTYNPTLYGFCQARSDDEIEACRKAAGLSPFDPAFTPEYLARAFAETKRKIAKQMNVDFVQYKAAGVGNGYWMDVLFLSQVHPQRKSSEITMEEFVRLQANTLQVLSGALAARGSLDEMDFFGVPGGYRRILGAHSKGQPCPNCGQPIQAKSLLGSTAYFCSNCQA
jgi:formamidopyrimidine-DNA glycosylase